MARKKGKGNIGDEDLDSFDDLDFDDWDDGEFDDFDMDKPASASKVAKETAKEAGRSFFKELGSKIARKSLPEEYGDHYQEALEYMDYAKEIMTETKDELNKGIYDLSKEVKKTLPFQSKLLNKYLESQSYKFEKSRNPSEHDIRDAALNSTLAEIFEKQSEINDKVDKAQSDDIGRKEQLASAKIQTNVLTNIDRSTSMLMGFHDGITKAYYRKSLELQFKSYYIQADLLKTTTESFTRFTDQFNKIVHNTSLPDMAKVTDEHLEKKRRDDIRRDTNVGKLFSNSDYVKKVKDRIRQGIKGKVSELTGGMSDIGSMLGQSESVGGASFLFQTIVGGLLGSAAGGKLGDYLSPKIKDRIGDDPRLKAGGNYLKLLGTNPQAFFETIQRKVRDSADEADPFSVRGRILEALSGSMNVFTPDKLNMKIASRDNMLTSGRAAVFDNRTHRSINQVIPLYLSKILAANQSHLLAYKVVNAGSLSGYSDVGELTYDYDTGKLSTMSAIRQGVAKRYFNIDEKKETVDVATSILGTTARNMSNSSNKKVQKASKNLDSADNRKMLSKYIDQVRKSGMDISKEDIFDIDTANPELRKMMLTKDGKENKKLKELLKGIKDNSRTSDMRGHQGSISGIGSRYPISSVIELYDTLSDIGGYPFKTDVTSKQAQVVAEVLTDYVIKTSSNISPEVILERKYIFTTRDEDGELTTNISPEQYKNLVEPMRLLIALIRKISGSDEQDKISAMRVAFAALDNALKNKMNDSRELFKKLNAFDSNIVDDMTLTRSNIMDGSLDEVSYKGNLSPSKIHSDLKQKLNLSESGLFGTGALDSVSGLVSDMGKFKAEFQQADMTTKLRMIKGAWQDTVSKAEEMSNRAYSKAKQGFESLGEELDKLGKEGITKAKAVFVSKMKTSLANFEKMSKDFIDTQTKLISEGNLSLQTLKETTNDESTIKEAEKSVEKLTKRKEKAIKASSEFSKQINALIKSVEEMDTEVGEVTTHIETMRTLLNDTIEKTQNMLAGLKG